MVAVLDGLKANRMMRERQAFGLPSYSVHSTRQKACHEASVDLSMACHEQAFGLPEAS